MPDLSLLIIVGVIFLLAGIVKGMVGFGLPLISIGLMTTIVGLPAAMALFLVPAFGTNLWQGFAGAHTARLFKRYWTFFIPTMFFTWPGTLALSRFDTNYMSALLGFLLCLYVLLSMTRSQFVVPSRLEKPLNPLVGVVSGLLAGMTGAFTMPGVVYLQSTQLKRDQLVQAMGMLFTLSTIGLGLSMGSQNLLSLDLGIASLFAVIPTFAGLMIGTRLRKRTSEESFRQVFLLALGALGLYIVIRSVLALSAA
ncbi:sulfite exporter TauE/SafE family protein [Hoeflea prorocentri]|uniref:Probable membrane transporter protein n=1 Tax=Hoeflea prorocentri TaxID=1922333 RepID=A0A9X3ZGW2_9HYPH|nr:sulfite exporter TauE/SafE family protein [Hoeflea prorocentri]MCY6380308.1 sulfite exporter TauE/SafE family protein [Hoeflea prorocentri]MDA5398108.1 sulfite exporter TauE/SafE family protein [Hoeflea prorocentri]